VGFVTGTAILVLVSTASMGIQVWPVYAHFLRLFGQVSRTEGRTALLRWQFVDLNSLSYAVPRGRSGLGLTILIGVAIMALLWLAILLWKSSAGSKPVQSLAWATVITWTLVLNVYVPIYDSILLTVALLLTLGALRDLEWNHAGGWFISLAVLIIAVSWITEPIAKSHGIQLLTILLFALGLWQAAQLQRAMQFRTPFNGVVQSAVENFFNAVVGETLENFAGEALGFVGIGAGHGAADGMETAGERAEIEANRARMPWIQQQQLGHARGLDVGVLALVEFVRGDRFEDGHPQMVAGLIEDGRPFD